jgi:hypothetical protein
LRRGKVTAEVKDNTALLEEARIEASNQKCKNITKRLALSYRTPGRPKKVTINPALRIPTSVDLPELPPAPVIHPDSDSEPDWNGESGPPDSPK